MAGFVLDKNNFNFSHISCLMQRCVNECGKKRRPPKRRRAQPGGIPIGAEGRFPERPKGARDTPKK